MDGESRELKEGKQVQNKQQSVDKPARGRGGRGETKR